MPRYTSSQTYTEGNTQIVALPDVPEPGPEGKVVNPEDEDLEVKLARISDLVPTRVQNTSGSSAGSGSGDFHQYRQMRRKEQDRVTRMEVEYKKRMEEFDFVRKREERSKSAEEKTAKRRAKRQKKKEKKKAKKTAGNGAGGLDTVDEDGEEESEEENVRQAELD
eukprot:TRINITY_DN3937_c1_g2_i2.p1 TRINITY_DN3937_c1_g2~~TRINITY_DN3937_c1_g2_i2.p1  ORF type:complete len:165 (+),score=52.59 TRINITY_DN3937_c1_g2_i2:143-637(+)